MWCPFFACIPLFLFLICFVFFVYFHRRERIEAPMGGGRQGYPGNGSYPNPDCKSDGVNMPISPRVSVPASDPVKPARTEEE